MAIAGTLSILPVMIHSITSLTQLHGEDKALALRQRFGSGPFLPVQVAWSGDAVASPILKYDIIPLVWLANKVEGDSIDIPATATQEDGSELFQLTLQQNGSAYDLMHADDEGLHGDIEDVLCAVLVNHNAAYDNTTTFTEDVDVGCPISWPWVCA